MSESGSEPFGSRPTHLPVSDEDLEPGPSNRSAAAQSRRGTRGNFAPAPKIPTIKSRCESNEGDEKCKNCLAAGARPSFKRGPPKGYIHAIEQRWHQVECILATIMASQRARDVIAELRNDSVARTILDRVDAGPYGGVGITTHEQRTAGDGLYNTIMTQSTQGVSDDRRSKRQSRMSREIVSAQDPAISSPPTVEWQEHLFRRLTSLQQYSTPAAPYSVASSDATGARLPSWSPSSGQDSPIIPPPSSEPSRRRRRVEGLAALTVLNPRPAHARHDPEEAYGDDEYDEAIDALGHLSVDNNQEFRYHGRSAGLYLLAKTDRKDDSEQKENGIWKFQSPHISADCQCLSFDQVNDRIELPDTATQDRLITLYFTYVHHYLPIVHKASFLAAYPERNLDSSSISRREPMQTVTKLLLLSMFAFAARYWDEGDGPHRTNSGQDELEAGHHYANDARLLLNTLYEDSRPSVVQALLILGIREFGIGSAAQGWFYIGMGCRMAIDLGMNRDADGWKDGCGNDLFTPVEKQIRRQIWWSCCIADKLSSTWLGRPVMYKMGDFDTPIPDQDINEDQELWRPYPRHVLGPTFTPMASHVMTCFRAQCKLSFIMSEIMAKMYPVKWYMDQPRRAIMDKLESALHNWMIDLPDELRYHESGGRTPPPPHVLILHAEYYSALLLLYRAFDAGEQAELFSQDPVHAKCFDVCQGAASKISSIITTFHDTFGLKRSPPFSVIYVQCAGIMHVVTLTRLPRDTQATIGLLQCIHAAEEMQNVWPSAHLVRNLLKGAKVQMADLPAHRETTSGRNKRPLDDILRSEAPMDLGMHSSYPQGLPSLQGPGPSGSSQLPPIMPPYGISSTSSPGPYVPGYEWWPPLVGPGISHPYQADPAAYPPGPMVGPFAGAPSSLFTFDPTHMSADFMHGVSQGDSGSSVMPQHHYSQHHDQQHHPPR
ncbi:hypothetical protein PHLGIDRAFT_11523 [Phlebiopsis gigantea 11061_1 CR5-6]|uniref:Xylanolytic transcriptional activator regulatory domain-containing protein n=1 Tax=Phlebiopsis gigantea (strain 11061_1 CR5-6) TaxID=745531 RepID=A0A0C3S3K3_PHLG1|nr:hypothetical protein PHLGIDRAFT_11523 [Phlebiopsis gigantea 11061_1 CR5-6]